MTYICHHKIALLLIVSHSHCINTDGILRTILHRIWCSIHSGIYLRAWGYDYTVYSSVQCAESGRFYWLTYRNTCPRFVELPRLLEHNRVLQLPLETAPEFRDVTHTAT